MNRFFQYLVAAAACSGCASSWVSRTEVLGPHRERAVEVACAGQNTGPSLCLDQAREACGGGDYEILASSTQRSETRMVVACSAPPPGQ